MIAIVKKTFSCPACGMRCGAGEKVKVNTSPARSCMMFYCDQCNRLIALELNKDGSVELVKAEKG